MEMGHECPTHVVEHATMYDIKLLILLHFGCLLLDHTARLDLVLCDGCRLLLCLFGGRGTFFPEALECRALEFLFTFEDLLLCGTEVLENLELLVRGHREGGGRIHFFLYYWVEYKEKENDTEEIHFTTNEPLPQRQQHRRVL